MTAGQVWRYLGPIAVVIVPFLLFAAQQGIPSGTWWDEIGDPAVWVTGIVSAMAVAFGVQSIRRAQLEARAIIEQDIWKFARRAFVPINARLPTVRVNQIGVHVWVVDGDHLRRLVKFTMEHERASTPITWKRGKGVIGLAWRQVEPLIADLTDIYASLDALDDDAIDALPPDQRYGLTAEETKRGRRYQAVLAYPLTGEDGDVIGVLSVDFGVSVPLAKLEALLHDVAFQDVLGSCEITLRRYFGR